LLYLVFYLKPHFVRPFGSLRRHFYGLVLP